MHFSKLLFIVQAAASAIPLALEPAGSGDIELSGEQLEAIRNGDASDWTEVADFNPDVPEQQRPVPAEDLSKRYVIHYRTNLNMLANFDCNVNKGLLREVGVESDIPYETDNGNRASTVVTWSGTKNVNSFDPLPIVTIPAGATSTSVIAVHNFCLQNSGNVRCSYQMRVPFKLEFRPGGYSPYPPVAQEPTLYEICLPSDSCPVNRVLRACETGMYQLI